jgi:hypothetical protein
MEGATSRALKERTTASTVVGALVVFGIGVALIYVSTGAGLWEPVLREIGSILLVTVTVGILWDLWSKRAFADEIWAKARLSHTLDAAGLAGFTLDFQQVPFQDLLENATRLDILFSYAETWRNHYIRQLNLIAATKGARIRVLLPDPDNQQVIQELSVRFDTQADSLRQRIREAKDFFCRDLHEKYPDGSDIQVWYFARAPHHTFYIIDNTAIIAMYYLQRGRGLSVPTFISKKGGSLYRFVLTEMEDIVRDPVLAQLQQV